MRTPSPRLPPWEPRRHRRRRWCGKVVEKKSKPLLDDVDEANRAYIIHGAVSPMEMERRPQLRIHQTCVCPYQVGTPQRSIQVHSQMSSKCPGPLCDLQLLFVAGRDQSTRVPMVSRSGVNYLKHKIAAFLLIGMVLSGPRTYEY